MKAKEFYSHWNSLVAEDWSSLGLSSLGTRGSKWSRPVGDLELLFEVRVNNKYPWTIESGGDFSAYAYLPREVPTTPASYVESVMDELHIFGTLNEQLTDELRAINQGLLDKLRAFDRDSIYAKIAEAYDCTPEQARGLELFETGLETLEGELEMPLESLVNPPLCYYESDDLEPWAAWFKRALPVMLDRIDSDPVYAFQSVTE